MDPYRQMLWQHMLHPNNLMLKANLEHIAKYASYLAKTIPDQGDVPDWVKDSVSRMRETMSGVKHFLEFFEPELLWTEQTPEGPQGVYRMPDGRLVKG